ncbi:MAG: sigma-70 family RNA polymerase sigma factor [bacterium]|nr:sigma-70 family RNA polymerase sigma factor [bacterium]
MDSAPSAQDESRWIDQCLTGDPDAFEPLIRHTASRIRGLVWGMLGERREDTEDVVQEIFLKAYMALPRFRRESRFSTWVHRIAVNHCRDIARRAPPPPAELDESTLANLPAPEPDEKPEEDNLDAEKAVAELSRLLDRMKEDHRRILVMREIEDLSYEEIGEILGIAPGTVRSRLSRARAALIRAAEKLENSSQ